MSATMMLAMTLAVATAEARVTLGGRVRNGMPPSFRNMCFEANGPRRVLEHTIQKRPRPEKHHRPVVRIGAGGAVDPIAACRVSRYRARLAAERPAAMGGGGGIA